MTETSPRTGNALMAFLGLNRGIAGLLAMVILVGMGIFREPGMWNRSRLRPPWLYP